MTRERLSVGIVGGGIAGLYCAWRLGQRGHRVTVFEHLGRLGGRIETLDLDGFKAECGPMRFELAIQTLFKKFAENDLGIDFAGFTGPRGNPADFPRYELKEDEKSSDQIEKDDKAKPDGSENGSKGSPRIQSSHLTVSLDLLRLGVYRIFNPDDWDERRNSWGKHLKDVVESRGDDRTLIQKCADELTGNGSSNGSALDEIRSRRRLRGDKSPLLHKTGFWNALAQVLSPGAVAKIRDVGTFYHLMPENPSASEWAIFWLRLFRSDADLSTILDGVGSVLDRIEDKLHEQKKRNELPGKNVDVWCNATVSRVRQGGTRDRVEVTVEHGPQTSRERLEEDFDHVILALPQWPLRRLTEFFPPQIREDIDGVIGFPMLKAFLVTKQPWWDKSTSAQYGADKVPTRELHYFDNKKPRGDAGSRGMIMLYTDRPATAFWQFYVQEPHLEAQKGEPDELKHELVRHLLVALRRDDAKNLTGDLVSELELEDSNLFGPALTTLLQRSIEEFLSKDESSSEDDLKNRVENELRAILGPAFDDTIDAGGIGKIVHRIGERSERRRDLALDANEEAIEEMSQRVTAFAIRDWSQPPFGAAAHAWAPACTCRKRSTGSRPLACSAARAPTTCTCAARRTPTTRAS